MPDALTYLFSLGSIEVIGFEGFISYISAACAVQIGLMDGNLIAYSLANTLAAILVGISLLAEFNLASALIQGSWIVIGTTGLMLCARRAWPSTRRILGATLEAEAP